MWIVEQVQAKHSFHHCKQHIQYYNVKTVMIIFLAVTLYRFLNLWYFCLMQLSEIAAFNATVSLINAILHMRCAGCRHCWRGCQAATWAVMHPASSVHLPGPPLDQARQHRSGSECIVHCWCFQAPHSILFRTQCVVSNWALAGLWICGKSVGNEVNSRQKCYTCRILQARSGC